MIRNTADVEIVSEEVHRVLAYVEALNRHGVRPARALVDEFAARPDRKRPTATFPAMRTAAQMIGAMVASWDLDTSGGETFCEYLARLSWIADTAQVELTPAGRALLKALNAPALEDASTDVFEVVLGPDNPFAYAQTLGMLSRSPRALLVEPYFRLEQLMDVAELDNIERVLLGPGVKRRDLEVLATGLAALPDERPLQVRVAAALHDRYLIPAGEEPVVMLGASLGGIGKKVSTITSLGDLASRALRQAHEDIWTDAAPLEPKTKAITPPQ